MIIQKLVMRNFRQYGDEQIINFSDDIEKLTIIYGLNGFGKTTLHQFFKWVLYDAPTFTTSDNKNLYSEKLMNEVVYETTVTVYGKIHFSHNGKNHILTRTANYKKSPNGNRKVGNGSVELLVESQNGNYTPSLNPSEDIEVILPQYLSEFFFFDGERVKNLLGNDRSTRRKTDIENVVNRLFGLEVYSNALDHLVGRKSTSLIKQYERDLIDETNDSVIKQYRETISNYKDSVYKANQNLEKIDGDISELREQRRILSERIGALGSLSGIERDIEKQKHQIKLYYSELEKLYKSAGESIKIDLSKSILSEKMHIASETLKRNISEVDAPGIKLELIEDLIQKYTISGDCICGKKLDEDALANLERLKKKLPPNSYEQLYNDFIAKSEEIHNKYDSLVDSFDTKIDRIDDIDCQIANIEKDISALIEKEKEYKEVKHDVEQRAEVERELSRLNRDRDKELKNKGEATFAMNKYQSQLENREKNNSKNSVIRDKMALVERVAAEIKNEYEDKKKMFKDTLEKNIGSFIDKTLNAKRSFSLEDNYSMVVKDEYGNEDKSQGQLAVTTFAFIGGMLKTISEFTKNSDGLSNYPLILDGPFSSLDSVHKKRVMEQIPEYSSQVVILTYDNLDEYSDEKADTYAIKANESRNDAEITTITKDQIKGYFDNNPKYTRKVA